MSQYIAGRRIPWKRFWTPWDGKIHCGFDGRGFLDDPEDSWGGCANPNVRSLQELLLKRCVVLSGPPGMGKTVAIEAACETLKKELQPPGEMFAFHCRAISSAEMLRAETVEHRRWKKARVESGEGIL